MTDTMTSGKADTDRFRLRRFVERLAGMDELEVHDEPVALADMSAILEASPKAVLFRNAGPEGLEIVGGVSGTRKRLAEAFGVGERELTGTIMKRLGSPQSVVEIPGSAAPVQQEVLQGKDIDLTRLPFHIQHRNDGGVYISSGLDFTIDPESGKRNVGARRMMLRGRQEFRTNLSNNSDLKRFYLAAAARKERLPIAFVVGSHPSDFFTSGLQAPTNDEFALLGTLRGEPIPMVKCVTSDVLVPADAEMVVEGYLDEQGYREMDGPYGEFWGYYGPMHIDPVFHVTAITRRRDMLHQTVVHGTHHLSNQEASHTTAVVAEMLAIRRLREAGIEPSAVFAVPSAPIFTQLRVALTDSTPEKARLAIETLFEMHGPKHITIVDEDIDVFDDEEISWALATRFNADRDILISKKFTGFYEDPSVDADNMVAKAGFDATSQAGRSGKVNRQRPSPPAVKPAASNMSVRAALEEGPKYFHDLLEATGSRDGREITLELDALRESGELTRLENGEYALVSQFPNRERIV